jgi:outer membrane protein insertion porin family
VRYDWRDSFIRPRKGGFASLSADISYGLENSLDNFIKYRLDLRTFISPADRLTLAWRGIGGYIQPYGVEGEIPQDQLFYLGGTGDVRGFEENLLRFDAELNPVGGSWSWHPVQRRAMTWGVTGRRLFLWMAAALPRPCHRGGEDRWRWTAGLGLRYITPIGAVGCSTATNWTGWTRKMPGGFIFPLGTPFRTVCPPERFRLQAHLILSHVVDWVVGEFCFAQTLAA